MVKFFSIILFVFFISCGGDNNDVIRDDIDDPIVDKIINISWTKVNNDCISTSGGYKLYYKTSSVFYSSSLNLDNFQTKLVPYSELSDADNPSTTLEVASGYTYVKVKTYCGSNESETSVYAFVHVD